MRNNDWVTLRGRRNLYNWILFSFIERRIWKCTKDKRVLCTLQCWWDAMTNKRFWSVYSKVKEGFHVKVNIWGKSRDRNELAQGNGDTPGLPERDCLIVFPLTPLSYFLPPLLVVSVYHTNIYIYTRNPQGFFPIYTNFSLSMVKY